MEESPLAPDADLEKNLSTAQARCIQTFQERGGVYEKSTFHLKKGDWIYPACSGGLCRSQTVWALLRPFAPYVKLFAPHAARHGWDPYNGHINRHRNLHQENVPDEFSLAFGIEKQERFGFENSLEWEALRHSKDEKAIEQISSYYTTHYYRPPNSWNGERERRVYITFSTNAHVVLYRLIQSNELLNGVYVVAFNLSDLITHPPAAWQTTPRSKHAYLEFAKRIQALLSSSLIENP